MKPINEYAWNALTISRLLAAAAFVIVGIVVAANGGILLGTIVALIALSFAVFEWRRVRRSDRRSAARE